MPVLEMCTPLVSLRRLSSLLQCSWTDTSVTSRDVRSKNRCIHSYKVCVFTQNFLKVFLSDFKGITTKIYFLMRKQPPKAERFVPSYALKDSLQNKLLISFKFTGYFNHKSIQQHSQLKQNSDYFFLSLLLFRTPCIFPDL